MSGFGSAITFGLISVAFATMLTVFGVTIITTTTELTDAQNAINLRETNRRGTQIQIDNVTMLAGNHSIHLRITNTGTLPQTDLSTFDIFSDAMSTLSRVDIEVLSFGPADTSGVSVYNLQVDDDIYAEYKLVDEDDGSMDLDTWTIEGLNGTISAVTLFTRYVVQNEYSGSNNLTFAIEGEALTPTTIQPLGVESGSEVQKMFTLPAAIDSWAEIADLNIGFVNPDGKKVSFDRVWLSVVFIRSPTFVQGRWIPYAFNSTVIESGKYWTYSIDDISPNYINPAFLDPDESMLIQIEFENEIPPGNYWFGIFTSVGIGDSYLWGV